MKWQNSGAAAATAMAAAGKSQGLSTTALGDAFMPSTSRSMDKPFRACLSCTLSPETLVDKTA